MCVGCLVDALEEEGLIDVSDGSTWEAVIEALPAPWPECIVVIPLIRTWYGTFDDYGGGPLHIQLEDDNLEDDSLTDEQVKRGWDLYEDQATPELRIMCDRIVGFLRAMPQLQRIMAVESARHPQWDSVLKIVDG